MDSTQSITRSAAHFFSGTLVSRISGMLRDIAMAYAFGTDPAIAAFLVSYRLAHLLRRLFGEGALQSAFIPLYESMRQSDPHRAQAFFRNLTASLSLFLCAIIVFSMLMLSFFTHSDIAFLTLLMFPSLLTICLYGLNASYLQCDQGYFVPSVAPAAFNMVWILGVLLLKNLPSAAAMPYLAGFVVLASLIQWLVTVPLIKKPYPKEKIQWFSKDLYKLGKPLALGIFGVAATQVNNALDAVFARFASLEGPAYLWYAIRLQQLPLALFGIALSQALLPPLTRAINTDAFSHYLKYAINRTLLLMVPTTAFLFFYGQTCIDLIFGRGDFTPQSSIGTTHCLWGYAIGLTPMALILIHAAAFYAKKDYYTPAKASFYAVLLNIFLNSVMVFGLHWGPASVALATSISAWFNFALLQIKLCGLESHKSQQY